MQNGLNWCARRDSNSRPVAPEAFSDDLDGIVPGGKRLDFLSRPVRRTTRYRPI